MQEKTCTSCGQTKDISEFNKDKGKPRAICKLCHRADSSKRQAQNWEKRRAYHQAWSVRNRDKTRAACNVALGILGDTPKRMYRVLAYMEGRL